MSANFKRREAQYPEARSPMARPAPIPPHRADELFKRSPIVNRAPASTTSSASTSATSCAANDNSGACQKPVSSTSNTTLPIALGVVIPLVVAFVIFAFLHRRHVRKLKTEDEIDRDQQLDFGMDDVVRPSSGKKSKHTSAAIPEMTITETEKTIRDSHSMSMDMSMSAPYLLAPEMQQSRESIISLSRSIDSADDRYRHASTFISHDRSRSQTPLGRRGPDDASSIGSNGRVFERPGSNPHYFRNHQHLSQSVPSTQRTSLASGRSTPLQHLNPAQPQRNWGRAPTPEKNGEITSTQGQNSDSVTDDSSRMSQAHLSPFIRNKNPLTGDPQQHHSLNRAPAPSAKETFSSSRSVSPPSPIEEQDQTSTMEKPPSREVNTKPPLLSAGALDHSHKDQTANLPAVLPPQGVAQPQQQFSQESVSDIRDSEEYERDFGYDIRRLTMGIRPLPPDDPSDDPEQRANRIRSFYKEYFDESKPSPVNPPERSAARSSDRFVYDGPIFDPASGQFITGGARFGGPTSRKMMTPPPRGSPRFRGTERRHQGTTSERNATPTSTHSSSVTFTKKKQLPPPSPLQVLPASHLIKDDTFLPTDFAPPITYNDRRVGTPETLKGGMRPYPPVQPARLPLASSFDDLSVMPSPHQLRSSATFSSIDFAPPPRFRSGADSASDSGSVHSSRSGVSAAQLHSIRAGAYRISRLPPELVGTRDDLATSIRPQWDIRK